MPSLKTLLRENSLVLVFVKMSFLFYSKVLIIIRTILDDALPNYLYPVL